MSKDITPIELRKVCHDFALRFVGNQKEQFKRLGTVADYDNPYLTLKPEFEARQIEIFGAMANKGYIYKGLKPVYWCAHCRDRSGGSGDRIPGGQMLFDLRQVPM